jgi:hypothetical protein
MKRVPSRKAILVWPCHPSLKEQQQLRDLRKESESGKKKSEDEKQTPEQMIHSLQSVFCGGRYRTWVFSREKPVTKTKILLQPPAGGHS